MATVIGWRRAGGDSVDEVDDTNPLPVNSGASSSTGPAPDSVLSRTGNWVIKNGRSVGTGAATQVTGATYTCPTGYQSRLMLATLCRTDTQTGDLGVRFRYTPNGGSAELMTSEALPPVTTGNSGTLNAYHAEPIKDVLLVAGDMVEWLIATAVTSGTVDFYMGIEETLLV